MVHAGSNPAQNPIFFITKRTSGKKLYSTIMTLGWEWIEYAK
jgi:hypothetical protein